MIKVAFLAYLIAFLSVLFSVSAEPVPAKPISTKSISTKSISTKSISTKSISTKSVPAQEDILQKLEVKEPRAFAYHIGDTLQRTVNIQLRMPYKLLTESLPTRKRMGRWIVVTSSKYKEKSFSDFTEYEINFEYQIINIIPELKEVILPRHYLSYADSTLSRAEKDKGEENISRLEVPPHKVGVSSVVKATSGDIQADKKPSLLPQSNKKLLLYGSFLLVALAGLALLFWGLPFAKKEQYFGDALLALKKLKGQSWNVELYGKVLKIIHQAFNSTASKTVFIGKVGEFLEEHEQFSPLQKEIETFFKDSEQYFFQDSNVQENKLNALIQFIQACHKIEQRRF